MVAEFVDFKMLFIYKNYCKPIPKTVSILTKNDKLYAN